MITNHLLGDGPVERLVIDGGLTVDAHCFPACRTLNRSLSRPRRSTELLARDVSVALRFGPLG
jgi:hypothetical protein